MSKPNRNQSDFRMEQGLRVSSRVQLESISLLESFCRRNRSLNPADLEIKQSRGVDYEFEKSIKQIRVIVRLTLSAVGDDASSANQLMEIEGQFLLVYSIDSLDSIEENDVRAFAEYNAVFNVWPYWREYVQNCTVRMGLPALTIPVYRIGLKKSASAVKDGKESDSQSALPESADAGSN